MILREMLTEDLDQVMEIEDNVFPDPWTKEGFFTFLIRKDSMFLVVEEKGRIIGYLGSLMVLDESDILNIAVTPERQKEGIGRFMLESLFRLSYDCGIRFVHLEVRESNETAIRLYERCGFQRDGLRKDYYTEPRENAVLMTKHM